MFNLTMPEEIKAFEQMLIKLERGEISMDDFKKFRLNNGTYGIRNSDDTHMMRIKCPLGVVNSDQLEAVAEVTEKFAPPKLAHVTTRQAFQIHRVKRSDVPKVLSILAQSGLTTREACGNTVRNVTASPYAGVDPTELFDVTPYAEVVMKYFLRNPLNQDLPRKFKIAFEGSQTKDYARLPIHDIGALAAVQKVDGKEVRGFKIYLGGGLGSHPISAVLLEPFTPVDLLLPTCEAAVRIHNRLGNRKNRSRARMKFLLEEWGEEKFRQTILAERTSVLLTRAGTAYRDFDITEEKAPAVSAKGEKVSSPEFEKWIKTNAFKQKQNGFYTVQIRCPLGDLTPAQLRGLAQIARKYCGGRLRTTITQNMVLRWVKEDLLGLVFKELQAIKLAFDGAEHFVDITRCPGSDTCNLAITKSRGLAQALDELFNNGLSEMSHDTDIDVKISGCPNSCGQHHIASLGFYGTARQVNGKLVPHYEMMVGGGTVHEKATFGQSAIRIPARRIPEAVKYLVSVYKKERQTGETFQAYAHRLGPKAMGEKLAQFTTLDAFDQKPETYQDWTEEAPFKLQVGKGECAA
ncbi:MAG: ferredoxin--nitrite reductase [Candidatus Omnitrophica bacterium CG11_big_fil_rev_8_21_14_0_20_45_26]|uniref:Ferredoxin--nitrite reductase n=1 Tax=Candidatus Abzuiibacterium crystallinum TaxID=1974748 RepID=A0A2H0LN31_9BACT|nr:MAG: ferredoxin--nitrite reductase [Candidatus Omnitrophica bacterium CG11_big_fil_rev_8_21_14_0_20_45_26]PIW64141.1 MAG: ferredoxin--nitrite reductase [Candidatus Omnitrophica bacterium CG12_big_fil_rev_8_21_14_0_65_45_16]